MSFILCNTWLVSGSFRRWILAQPAKAAISDLTHKMANMNVDDLDEISTPGMSSRMEALVGSVENTVTSMKNPFEETSHLVSISTRIIPPENVASDIKTAYDQGLRQYEGYVNDCLVSQNKEVFDRIPMLKLKDFGTKPPRTGKLQRDKLTASQDRTLYSRLLVVSQVRNPNLKEIMGYNLSTYPLALATSEGVKQSAKKETLMHALEKASNNPRLDMTQAQKPIAYLIDAMAMVRSTAKDSMNTVKTFGELADLLYRKVQQTATAYGASRVDWVCDQYKECSIKNAERLKREEATGSQRITITDMHQRLPRQFASKFLKNSDNKTDLLQFLYLHFLAKADAKVETLVSNAMSCSKMAFNGQPSQNVDALRSGHEEADTRLFLHAQHAMQNGFNTVLVASPDTDVLVIGLGFVSNMTSPAALGMVTGTSNRRRIIDIKQMAETLGHGVASALPFLHALSGCDSISAFHNKGKVKPLNLLRKEEAFQCGFANIHQSLTPSAENMALTELFVCKLYGTQCEKVNDARYKLYKTNCAPSLLPPNDDALSLHLQRAVYQCHIWKDTSQQLALPSPVDHGWCLRNNCLDIVWNNRAIADPQDLQVGMTNLVIVFALGFAKQF